ncbi:hypothetical protein VCSRO25_0598 [Vibrio cholerae]|nr:hypothetical protein VCSRO25_0598 [Vibrio cholerae]
MPLNENRLPIQYQTLGKEFRIDMYCKLLTSVDISLIYNLVMVQ